jgi:hypothetical protein
MCSVKCEIRWILEIGGKEGGAVYASDIVLVFDQLEMDT